MSNRLNIKTLFGLGIILLVFSCYEPITECLDIYATNYDVSADKACDECCTYPSLSITIEHTMNDSMEFAEDSVYYTKFNSEYQIKNLQYFISNFNLLDENLEYNGVIDSILIKDDEANELELEDNFSYVTINNNSYTFGTFIAPGTYSKIRFMVGLEALVNHGDLSSLDGDHPLVISKDSMYIDQTEGFYFNKLKLIRDPSNSNITDDINIQGDEHLVMVEIDHSFTVGPGDNVSLKIKADYSKWFNNQELDVLSIEEIISNFVSLTASVFSIIE